MPLLDHRGQPLKTADFKKADPPKTGEAFGRWAGTNGLELLQLPGGGIVQFDLSKLTLEDYRAMLTHYQVNSSLSVLSFMQHQSTWTIECDDKKIADHCTENMSDIWTQLNRAMSQANWAGYSPNVLQWENDLNSNKVMLTKVKDLIPEFCVVNWKEVDGWKPPDSNAIPPKLRVYDGIKQFGFPFPIPVANSYWYPILMENGDYYGKKLLKAAYTSYFFSMLMHLFSNRYYERFGEPVPIGRAPFDDVVSIPQADGTTATMRSNEYMLQQMMSLRNRSVVVLPSDRDQDANGRGYFDYDLQYLESQMRGADFERYMSRLDQEISLAIFTPILLMNVADVGSYNLGVGHMQMYLWMLNALNGDRKTYMDKYILNPMVDYNFGPKAPRAKIKFQKLDNTNSAMIGTIIQALIQGGQVKFDMVELGQLAGLTMEQIAVTAAPAATSDPAQTDPQQKPTGKDVADPPKAQDAATDHSARPMTEIQADIVRRVTGQVENAFRDGRFGKDFRLSMGYKRRMEQTLAVSGVTDADAVTEGMYSRLDGWADDMADLGAEYVGTPERFIEDFTKVLEYEVSKVK